MRYKEDVGIAVVEQSGGAEDFWFSFHDKRENAEKISKKINKATKGTKAKARVEFARNYNPRGKPYGVFVSNLDLRAEQKLTSVKEMI